MRYSLDMKNIFLITGSPRRGGNTDILAGAFIKGAEEAGHCVTKFEAGTGQVKACKACNKCWSKGTPCVQSDNFSEMLPILQNADVLALASPLYWFGVSAQIKSAVDRLYCFAVPSCPEPLRIKEAVLLMCGGDTQSEIFGGAIATFRLTTQYMKWSEAGVLTVPGVHFKGAMAKQTGYLERAEALGRAI